MITMHYGEEHKQFITSNGEGHIYSSESFFLSILRKNNFEL